MKRILQRRVSLSESAQPFQKVAAPSLPLRMQLVAGPGGTAAILQQGRQRQNAQRDATES